MIGRILLGLLAVNSLGAQGMGPRHFDVVSVKACKAEGGRSGGGEGASPGRLHENCVTVMNLIRQAFVEYAGGRQNMLSVVPIEGAPAWIDSASYEIDATAEGAPGFAMMRGPMLQAVLEDRFKLKIRRESKEVPVYELTVAKGGPKLAASKEGSCVPVDYSLPTPYPQFCGLPKRGDPGLHLIGATMADLCKILSVIPGLDREIVDKTGIAGMFDIQLPGPGDLGSGGSGRREIGPGSDDPAAPVAAMDPSSSFETIKTAVQKFGLTLERAKGPGEFLVIDRVERPSEN
jgi:uncharacterized protein (TIGR03435 family)